MIEGNLVEGDKIIKDHIQGFCESLFTESETWRPTWEDENLKKLSEEDKEWLERPFSFEEMEAIFNSFGGDKAPGPDAFNLYFFQKCRNTVKEDVWNAVVAFHQKGTFVKSLNSAFITLIPKKEGSNGSAGL